MASDIVIRVAIDAAGAAAGGAAAEASVDKVTASGKKAQETTDTLSKRFRALQESIDPSVAAAHRLTEATNLLFQAQRAGLVTADETLRLLELESAALSGQIAPYQAKIAELERETELMKLSDSERELAIRQLEIENELKAAGVIVTEEQTAAITAQIKAQQAVTAAQAEAVAAQKAAQAEANAPGLGGAAASLVGGFAAAAGGLELFHLADELGQLHNQLRVVTTSEADLATTQERLYQIAQHTRTSWEDTAATYSRVFQATRELGKSEDDVARFTLELSEAFKVAGVSAGEQTRVTRDLLHGLDQGTLQWRQLQAIMAQTPSIARIIADHFHTTTGELHELAKQGKITGETIMQAFDEAAPHIEAAFAKTTPTLSQAWTNLENSVMHVLDKLTPVIELLAKALGFVADGIGFVADHFQVLSTLFSPIFSGLGLLKTGFDALSGASSWLGEKLGSVGEALGLTGDSFFDTYRKEEQLREQTDAMTEAIARSEAQFATWNVLMAEGVNVQLMNQKIIISDLSKQLEAYAAKIKEITVEKFTGTGAFKGADDMLKVFNRDDVVRPMVKAHKEAEEAARKHAEELKRLKGELDNLAGAASPLAKAIEDLAKAERLVQKAEADHIPISQAVLEGLEQRRRKVQELEAQEEAASVANQIRQAQRKADILLLQQEVEANEKLLGGNNELMSPEWSKDIEKQTDAFAGLREEIDRMSKTADRTLVNAFNHASDALTSFLRTGEFDFSAFINSVLDDLEKLLVRKALLALLGTALGGASGVPSTSGIGGPDDLMAPGFATGGQWYDRGSGGSDSTLQVFRTSPGERITVETPHQQAIADAGGGGGGSVTVRPTLVFDMRSAISEGIRSDVGRDAIFDVLQTYRDSLGPLVRAR